MTQKALGRHNNQGLAKIAFYLAAQPVEILGRGRHVANLHIIVGTQLEKTLQPGTGVFRPQSFPAVREQQHQAA